MNVDSPTQTIANQARREISRRFVAMFREYVGRGPARARAYFAPDIVLVVLEGTLTKAELTLARESREELVRELRRGFQGAMHDRAAAIVEEETGRRVEAALSDHSVLPDYAVECFVLEPGDPSQNGAVAAGNGELNRNREISRAMISLFKQYTGRGPTRARTHIHEDFVLIVLEGTLTEGERKLAEADRDEVVRELRRHFQGAMQDDAVEAVESKLDGRAVVQAFLSDNSVHPDYAIELFLLRPPDCSV